MICSSGRPDNDRHGRKYTDYRCAYTNIEHHGCGRRPSDVREQCLGRAHRCKHLDDGDLRSPCLVPGPHVTNIKNNGSLTTDDEPDWSPNGTKIVYLCPIPQIENSPRSPTP